MSFHYNQLYIFYTFFSIFLKRFLFFEDLVLKKNKLSNEFLKLLVFKINVFLNGIKQILHFGLFLYLQIMICLCFYSRKYPCYCGSIPFISIFQLLCYTLVYLLKCPYNFVLFIYA